MTDILLNIVTRLERIEQILKENNKKKNFKPKKKYYKPRHNNNNKFNKDDKPRLDNYCDQAMYEADWWKRGEKEGNTEE